YGGSSRIWHAGEWIGEVEIQRGVRQGDIISPIIFNLCLKPLLDKLDEGLRGISADVHKITHTAFADDLTTILTGDDDRKELHQIIDTWDEKSGLKINKK